MFGPFRQFLDELNESADGGEIERHEAIDLLATVRILVRELKVLDDTLVGTISAGVGNMETVDERARVRWGKTSVRWNKGEDGVYDVVPEIFRAEHQLALESTDTAVDPETGERVATWSQAVEAISTHWNLAGPRVTALKERLGLDPDEFRKSGKSKATVELL